MENLNLIRKIAWSFHYTTGIELDEIIAETSLAYCEALHKFDPNKGKLSTFMYHHLTNHLKNWLANHQKTNPQCIPLEDIRTKEDFVSFFFEELSREAQEIAEVILTNPKAYVALESDEAIQRVANVLKKQGWSMKRIWIGIHDLRLAYS